MDLPIDSYHVETSATQYAHKSVTLWYGSVRLTTNKGGHTHTAQYDFFSTGFDTRAEAEDYAKKQGQRRGEEILAAD